MYKWSKYNYITEDNNKIIVWNTYSGALVKIEKEYYENIINNDITNIMPSDIACLQKNGFLVEDEEGVLNTKIIKKNKVTFTIALTKGCNAQCYYCYQHDQHDELIKESIVCIEEVDGIIKFIEEQAKGCIAMITWFGGEPLLKYDTIKYICEKLIIRKVSFVSSIITNGERMNFRLINEYKNLLNLKDVQITIDGLYKKHDDRKKFSSKNVFEKLIKLIYNLLDNGINVRVRINVSKYNIDETSEIYEYLYKLYSDYKNCQIYFALVSDDNSLYDYAFSESEREEIFTKIYNKDYFDKVNYKLPKRRAYFCGAESSNSHFIDIYGNLYMCEHDFWNFKKTIGTITKFDEVHYRELKEHSLIDHKCISCAFLPVCRGGCRRNKYSECPAFIFRAKNYLKALLEE